MIITVTTFYKVVLLNVSMFETSILDERHFATRPEAEQFANTCSGGGVPVIIEM